VSILISVILGNLTNLYEMVKREGGYWPPGDTLPPCPLWGRLFHGLWEANLFHGLQDSNCHHGARARMGSELLDRSVLYRSAADRKLAADNSAVERPVADSQLRLLLSHCSTGRLLR